MNKYNKCLPVLSLQIVAAGVLLCALPGCTRDEGKPMPPPGKPPRPQASMQTPAAGIHKALFSVPASSVRYDNGQVLIAVEHVIHT
jgi:hypothetical protein